MTPTAELPAAAPRAGRVAAGPGRRVRLLCVASELLGNRTFAGSLRAALATLPHVEVTYLPINGDTYRRHPAPRLARLSSPIEGQWVARQAFRAAHAGARFDAAIFTAWDLVPAFGDLLRTAPAAVVLDVTPRDAARLVAVDESALRQLRARVMGRVYDRQLRAVASRVRAWLPMNAWCARSLRNAYGIAPERIDVVYNPLDLETWVPRPRAPHERPVLLFVGNDFDRKGGSLLLDCYARFLRERCDLHIASNDPSLPARVHDVPGVHLFAGVGRSEMLALFQGADLFVFPTRRDYAPQVLAEASATGLPAVATDVGGIADVVRPGETGALLPRDAGAEAWATAIRTLLDDPAARLRYGAAARAFAEHHFSMPRFTDLVGRVVDRLTGAP